MKSTPPITLLAAAVALAGGGLWAWSQTGPSSAGRAAPSAVGVVQASAQGVEVQDGFVQAVPPGSDVSSAYFTLRNRSDRPITLLGASAPFAGAVGLMRTAQVNGGGHDAAHAMTGMQPVSALALPPGKSVTLTPGETHLMLEKLTRVPREGERVRVTLRFAGGQELTVELPVRRLP